jgi:hypothetical protein
LPHAGAPTATRELTTPKPNGRRAIEERGGGNEGLEVKDKKSGQVAALKQIKINISSTPNLYATD